MSDIIPLLLVILILGCWLYTSKEKEKQYAAEREQWNVERQQLMDRVQAGSFVEYKQAEVKIIKAQRGEQEPPKLEPL